MEVMLAFASVCLPHTRGGEPFPGVLTFASPIVFPTRVGVNLVAIIQMRLGHCLPHTRGGEPTRPCWRCKGEGSSPHAWG